MSRIQNKLHGSSGGKDPENLPRNMLFLVNKKRYQDIKWSNDKPVPEKRFTVTTHEDKSHDDKQHMIKNGSNALDRNTPVLCDFLQTLY